MSDFVEVSASRSFRSVIYLLGLAGAALFTILLIREGASSVVAALTRAGWGILAVAAFHFVPIFCDTNSWRVLFPKENRPPLRQLYWMRWIGDSITNLAPAVAVGGDIVRARLAALMGTPLATAAATAVVDVTLGVVIQILFTLFGLVMLVHVSGRTNLVRPTLWGAALGFVAISGFLLAQKMGIFRMAALVIRRLVHSPEWASLTKGGERLDQAIKSIYADPVKVVACCGWSIVSLLVSSGEIWIALHALGLASVSNAIILQSMAMTIRSAAFAVPAQLGVQESGYLVLGGLLGIPGETALAISLIARARDLIAGIPALILWQIIEGRRVWETRAGQAFS